MKANQIAKFIVSILLPLGIGSIAGMFTAEAIPGWYATLNQPSFNPPNWIFGPVWTTLYLVMGISFFLIWKLEAGKERNQAIGIFLAQLLLNFGWSFFFFYFKMIGLALLDIVILWMAIAVMLFRFYKLRPLAAYLNIPYLLWVTFASALNIAYFLLNRGCRENQYPMFQVKTRTHSKKRVCPAQIYIAGAKLKSLTSKKN